MTAGRDVGEVHQHPQAVHLAHHLLAEGAEAAVLRLVGGGVGPVGVAAVGEGHVADAQVVVGAQGAQAVLEGAAVLHAEERGDLARPVRGLDVLGPGGEDEGLRVGRDHAAGEVDLLELHPRAARVHRGDPDRPELRSHLALAQPREVGLVRGALAQVVLRDVAPRGLADEPGGVVVAVHQGDLLQDLAGLLQGRVLGERGGRDDENGEKAASRPNAGPPGRPRRRQADQGDGAGQGGWRMGDLRDPRGEAESSIGAPAAPPPLGSGRTGC